MRKCRELAGLVENGADFVGTALTEALVLFVNAAGQKLVGLEERDVCKTIMSDLVAEGARRAFQSDVLPADISRTSAVGAGDDAATRPPVAASADSRDYRTLVSPGR